MALIAFLIRLLRIGPGGAADDYGEKERDATGEYGGPWWTWLIAFALAGLVAAVSAVSGINGYVVIALAGAVLLAGGWVARTVSRTRN